MAGIVSKGLLVFILIFILFPSLIVATQHQLPLKEEKINPGSFYYPFKRLWEKTRERLIFSTEGRVKFYDSLLDKRLIELKYVSENKLLGEMERSSQRLSFQAGVLKEELKKLNNAKRIQQVLDKYEVYSKLLGKLRDLYPANSAYWLLLQQNIDTLKILSDSLK